MEITLHYDDGPKTFRQETLNFKTMLMAVEWQANVTKEVETFNKLMQMAIDEEIDFETDEEVQENLEVYDPTSDLHFTADLIVSFFDGQFTYDDFYNYAYFETIGDFYQLGADIVAMASNQKGKAEKDIKKKPRKNLKKST